MKMMRKMKRSSMVRRRISRMRGKGLRRRRKKKGEGRS